MAMPDPTAPDLDPPAPAPGDRIHWDGGARPWSLSILGLLWLLAGLAIPVDRLVHAPTTLAIVAASVWAVVLPLCWLCWEWSCYRCRIRARYRVTDLTVVARAVAPLGMSPNNLWSFWYLLYFAHAGPVLMLCSSGLALMTAAGFAQTARTLRPLHSALLANATGLRATCNARGHGDIHIIQSGFPVILDHLADVPALRAIIESRFQTLRDAPDPLALNAASPAPESPAAVPPDRVPPDRVPPMAGLGRVRTKALSWKTCPSN